MLYTKYIFQKLSTLRHRVDYYGNRRRGDNQASAHKPKKLLYSVVFVLLYFALSSVVQLLNFDVINCSQFNYREISLQTFNITI